MNPTTNSKPTVSSERSSNTMCTVNSEGSNNSMMADQHTPAAAASGQQRHGIHCVKAKPFPHDEARDTKEGRRRHRFARRVGKLILTIVIVGSIPAILVVSSIMGLAACLSGQCE